MKKGLPPPPHSHTQTYINAGMHTQSEHRFPIWKLVCYKESPGWQAINWAVYWVTNQLILLWANVFRTWHICLVYWLLPHATCKLKCTAVHQNVRCLERSILAIYSLYCQLKSLRNYMHRTKNVVMIGWTADVWYSLNIGSLAAWRELEWNSCLIHIKVQSVDQYPSVIWKAAWLLSSAQVPEPSQLRRPEGALHCYYMSERRIRSRSVHYFGA